MRRVMKGFGPPDGIRGANWIGAGIALRRDIQALATLQAKRIRARTEFNDAVDKPVAAAVLAQEQRGLCAFCEQQVRAQNPVGRARIRIAHWSPVSATPEQALDWTNLFASCSAPDSCDQHQRDQAPGFLNPGQEHWTRHMDFRADGSVAARPTAPPEFQHALQEPQRNLWNLNSASIRAARQAAIEIELSEARDERDRRRAPKAEVIAQRVAALTGEPMPFQSAVLQAFERWRTSN